MEGRGGESEVRRNEQHLSSVVICVSFTDLDMHMAAAHCRKNDPPGHTSVAMYVVSSCNMHSRPL